MKIRREAKTGIYALLMLASLYWGVNFLRGRDLFNTSNTYFGEYEQVNGIQKSSPVVIRGVKVGVVSDIVFDPSESELVVLQFGIKSKFKIPDNSQARIYSDGLLGGKAVEIVLGDSERFLSDRDTIRSMIDKDLIEMAGSELDFLKQKATSLVDNVNKTLTSLNDILADNSHNISIMTGNLAQMSSSLNTIVTGERRNLSEIVRSIEKLTSSLRDNADNIDNIIANFEGFSENLASADIKTVADNLTATLEQLECTVSRINSGEGTAGRLVNDDELYNSLLKAADDLGALLEDLKKNPGRYVSVSLFGRRQR